jgi:hypothetical protein
MGFPGEGYVLGYFLVFGHISESIGSNTFSWALSCLSFNHLSSCPLASLFEALPAVAACKEAQPPLEPL